LLHLQTTAKYKPLQKLLQNALPAPIPALAAAKDFKQRCIF
jgi:hypothetical protein